MTDGNDQRDPSCLPVGLRVGEYEIIRELSASGPYHVSQARRVGGGGELDGGQRHCGAADPDLDSGPDPDPDPDPDLSPDPDLGSDPDLAAYSPGPQEVVLKCLAPDADPAPLHHALLFEEALLLMQLSHPGVRRCVEVMRAPPMQVLEYVQGGSLSNVLALMRARGEPFRWHHALLLAHQVADALVYLRERGIAHGDLGPTNILLTRQGRAVLIDFTYGHWPDRRFCRRPLPMPKKPGHSAPEHWQSAELTPATDMYGLGATLWELVVGRPPEHVQELPDEGEPLPPVIALGQALPQAPTELCALVDSMLRLDPSRRPVATAAFVRTLAALADDLAGL